jgi:hypothetical protein
MRRIEYMTRFIEEERSILDVGCGRMWLKQYLPRDMVYYGCDYKARDDATIVCDFNKYEFPQLTVDMCFISGCIEYVRDVDWFLGKVQQTGHKAVLSYCSTDVTPDLRLRRKLAWQNHMGTREIVRRLESTGYMLAHPIERIDGNEIICVVRKLSSPDR